MIPKMSNYEKIQEHEYQDIYRIQYGVLLIVNKYKRAEQGYLWESEYKKKVKKVKGLPKCFVTTEEITNTFRNITWPVGTIFFNGSVIIPSTNPDDFKIEIKFSGGALEGPLKDMDEFKRRVDEILAKYR